MLAMKKWRMMKPITIGVCIALLAGSGAIPPQAGARGTGNFSVHLKKGIAADLEKHRGNRCIR